MAVQLPYARFGEVAPLYEQVPFGGAHAEAALLHPQSRLFVDDATTLRWPWCACAGTTCGCWPECRIGEPFAI